MDAEGGLHQPLAEGKGVIVMAGPGRFAEPEANLQFEEHKSEEAVRQSERLLTARFEVPILGEEPNQICL